MSLDWGFIGFMTMFLTLTIGSVVTFLVLFILHINRPRVFDKYFLRQPHFTADEVFYGKTGGIMGLILTMLVCMLITFPGRSNFSWRKLGDIRSRISKWYRWLIVLFLGLLISISTVLGIGFLAFGVYEAFFQ